MIRSIEIQCASHATEDIKKVIEAVKNIVPIPYRDLIVLKKNNLKGHHGNPIILLKSKVDDDVVLSALIDNLSRQMDTADRAYLSANLKDHVDESGFLYLRFDKQSAFLGKLRLGREDPIRIQLKFNLKGKGIRDIEEACKTLNLIP